MPDDLTERVRLAIDASCFVGSTAVLAPALAAEARRLKAENERLAAAIRKHRDQKADDRCWMDDDELYAVLGEGEADDTLPPECEFLESCRRFYRQRQFQSVIVDPTQMTMRQLQDRIAELEAENDRLNQLICDFQAASMLDVGNQGGPCRVEPRHIETEITRLRAALSEIASYKLCAQRAGIFGQPIDLTTEVVEIAKRALEGD